MSQTCHNTPARKAVALIGVLASPGHAIPIRYGYSIKSIKPASGTKTGIACPKCGSRFVYLKFEKTRCLNCEHRW